MIMTNFERHSFLFSLMFSIQLAASPSAAFTLYVCTVYTYIMYGHMFMCVWVTYVCLSANKNAEKILKAFICMCVMCWCTYSMYGMLFVFLRSTDVPIYTYIQTLSLAIKQVNSNQLFLNHAEMNFDYRSHWTLLFLTLSGHIMLMITFILLERCTRILEFFSGQKRLNFYVVDCSNTLFTLSETLCCDTCLFKALSAWTVSWPSQL